MTSGMITSDPVWGQSHVLRGDHALTPMWGQSHDLKGYLVLTPVWGTKSCPQG